MKDRPKTKKQRKMFADAASAGDVVKRAAAVTAGSGISGSADRLGTPGQRFHRFVG